MISRRPSSAVAPASGFSLIELVMVILLVGLAATLGLNLMGGDPDAEKFETTRAQLEQIRTAILGDVTRTQQGHRLSFGYVGDWGTIPSNLGLLITAQTPAWAYNSAYGMGVGWNGPYLTGLSGANPLLDAWGATIAFNPATGQDPISLGSDRAAGGNGFARDLAANIVDVDNFRSTVTGTVLNGPAYVSSAIVELRYPVNGTLTAFTTTTNGSGAYSFTNVPFGVRALSVISNPRLGPVPVVVDTPRVYAPLNFYQ